jgi:hypothetical protein
MKAESPEALIVGARAAGLTLAIDRREFNPLQFEISFGQLISVSIFCHQSIDATTRSWYQRP